MMKNASFVRPSHCNLDSAQLRGLFLHKTFWVDFFYLSLLSSYISFSPFHGHLVPLCFRCSQCPINLSCPTTLTPLLLGWHFPSLEWITLERERQTHMHAPNFFSFSKRPLKSPRTTLLSSWIGVGEICHLCFSAIFSYLSVKPFRESNAIAHENDIIWVFLEPENILFWSNI